MSKKKSQDEMKMMESVAGVLLSIVGALVALVREFGGTFADFHRLTTPEGADDLKAIAAIIARAKKTAGKSFKDLLAACKQAWVDSRFNAENFPLEPVADDEDEWEVFELVVSDLFNQIRHMPPLRFIFDRLCSFGFRPCGVRRAMEYIADGHLDAQLENPLLIPVGWFYPENRNWFVPILYKDDKSGAPFLEFQELDARSYDRCNCNDVIFPNDVIFLVLRRKRLEEEYIDLLPGVED